MHGRHGRPSCMVKEWFTRMYRKQVLYQLVEGDQVHTRRPSSHVCTRLLSDNFMISVEENMTKYLTGPNKLILSTPLAWRQDIRLRSHSQFVAKLIRPVKRQHEHVEVVELSVWVDTNLPNNSYLRFLTKTPSIRDLRSLPIIYLPTIHLQTYY